MQVVLHIVPAEPGSPCSGTIQDGFTVFPARFGLISAWSVPGEGCALGQAAESGETRDGKGGTAVRRSLLLQEFAALTGVSCVHSGMSGLGHDKRCCCSAGLFGTLGLFLMCFNACQALPRPFIPWQRLLTVTGL